MTIALIAAAVVVFLAFDAYLLWRLFGSGNRDAIHGVVSAPGEATLQLPAGTARVTYQESVHSPSGGGRIAFDPPAGLQVAITSRAGGVPLELRPRGGRQAQTIVSWLPGGPRSRVFLGEVEIPLPGTYAVQVTGGRGVRPQILLGR
jgi:hypothetical protein